MNIQEVTKLAMEKGLTIYRRNWREDGLRGELLPTNDAYHGMLYTVPEKKTYAQRWQPSADDLTANDWEVTGLIKDRDYMKNF